MEPARHIGQRLRERWTEGIAQGEDHRVGLRRQPGELGAQERTERCEHGERFAIVTPSERAYFSFRIPMARSDAPPLSVRRL